jgi:hypothetical protein
MKEIISELMAMDTLMAEKKGGKSDGKTVDIRPQIDDITLIPSEQGATLRMVLANGSGGSLKPELLVQTLSRIGGIELNIEKIVRTNLYTTLDGKRTELLEIG